MLLIPKKIFHSVFYRWETWNTSLKLPAYLTWYFCLFCKVTLFCKVHYAKQAHGIANKFHSAINKLYFVKFVILLPKIRICLPILSLSIHTVSSNKNKLHFHFICPLSMCIYEGNGKWTYYSLVEWFKVGFIKPEISLPVLICSGLQRDLHLVDIPVCLSQCILR